VSAFADLASIAPQQIWDGVVGRTVHGERLTFSVVELEPDAEVPEHRHENEQLGMLLTGLLVFRIGDEQRELRGPGGTWLIPSNVPHSVTAGPEGAVLIEVFSPPRADWAGIPQQAPSPGRWP
jgi:quercetin dioxygenase-like cupin family protein